MNKMRTNINVQEFLRDTNKKVKICSDNDKIFSAETEFNLAKSFRTSVPSELATLASTLSYDGRIKEKSRLKLRRVSVVFREK